MDTDEPSRASPAIGHPDELLCFAIYSTGLAVGRLYKPMLRRVGLTYPQYLVMIALWERDGWTVTDLGRAMMLESNTLTPLLKRLEASGWIVRRRDDKDERKVRLWLTERGKSLRGTADDFQQCISAVTGISNEDLGDLRDRVLSLRQAIDVEAKGQRIEKTR